MLSKKNPDIKKDFIKLAIKMKLNPRFLMEEFKKGKTPEQVIKERIASKNTAYKYWSALLQRSTISLRTDIKRAKLPMSNGIFILR